MNENESLTVTLTLENNEELECAVLNIFKADEKEYIALLPLDENGDNTDGQIYLETEMFNAGFRPAVNAGLSVSRVGGSAQIKAMKKVAGTLKLAYSQFRELQAFSQFGSDLDADTKKRLEQGARIVEVLKQPQNSPIPVEKQVIIIYAVVSGALLDIPANQIGEFEKELFSFVDSVYGDIPESIRTTGKLEKDAEEALKGVLSAYTENFIKAH